MQMPNQMIVKDVIKDEVELALRLRDIPEKEIEERAAEAMKACGLYSMRKWPVDSVSYGQKKRVTVASIMALGPDTIILDEPTAGQDYRHYTDIIKFINKLNSEYGKTIIFITHDIGLAYYISDTVYIMEHGKEDGKPRNDLASLIAHREIYGPALIAGYCGDDVPQAYVRSFSPTISRLISVRDVASVPESVLLALSAVM